MSAVVKKGWLSKREEVSGSLTTWRKRWFTLSDDELAWYKSDRDPLTGAAPLGSVSVASIEEVKFAYLEKKYCFTIRTHDQIFGVHADDAEGRDAWLMTFSDLMLKAKSADPKKREQAKKDAPATTTPSNTDAPSALPASPSPSSTPTTPSPVAVPPEPSKQETKEEEPAPTPAPLKKEEKEEKQTQISEPIAKKEKEESTKKSSDLRIASSKKEDRDEERQKVEQYVFFEIRGRCPNCMQGMVVNGPVRSLRCVFCESKIELRADKLWDTLLARISHNDYGTLAKNGMINSTIGGGYLAGRSYVFNDNIMKEVSNPVDSVVSYLTIGHGFERPKCPSCKTSYENVASVANGDDRMLTCNTCGHNALTFPLPKWMMDEATTDRASWQIFCATDRYDLEEEALQEALEIKLNGGGNQTKELVMGCPKCQRSIDLSSSKAFERIVSCEHCGVNVVRPRVDPVRKARRWYIRYYY